MTEATERPDTPAQLLVGLVNNMPAAAKRATTEQFTDLLAMAAETARMRIRFFSVDNDAGTAEDTFHHLRQLRPDALIVTGDEPRRGVMSEEPLWPCLSRLVDWAAENTVSAIWSCMAAHAAVFHLDQVARKRMPQKLSGMYEVSAATDHPLLTSFPPSWLVPHSRFNYVDEGELRDKGYEIIAHAPRIGADCFTKQAGNSVFVMLQGHPEYTPDSLFREYRRDIRRYLTGESGFYPEMPENYFDRVTAKKLAKLRDQAHRSPSPRLLASVYTVFAGAAVPDYPSPVRQFYANWLTLAAREKATREIAAHWPLETQRGAA